jgi:hypothetical protein
MPRQKPQDNMCRCGHRKAAHTYIPSDDTHQPPRICVVPGCSCNCFFSRRQLREALYEDYWHDYMTAARRDAGLKPASHDKLMGRKED